MVAWCTRILKCLLGIHLRAGWNTSHIKISDNPFSSSAAPCLCRLSPLTVALQIPKASSTDLPQQLILIKTLAVISQEIICTIMWIKGRQLQRLNQESPTAMHCKIIYIYIYKYSIITQQTNNCSSSFYIIPIWFLPEGRSLSCSSPPRKASIQTQLF